MHRFWAYSLTSFDKCTQGVRAITIMLRSVSIIPESSSLALLSKSPLPPPQVTTDLLYQDMEILSFLEFHINEII